MEGLRKNRLYPYYDENNSIFAIFHIFFRFYLGLLCIIHIHFHILQLLLLPSMRWKLRNIKQKSK